MARSNLHMTLAGDETLTPNQLRNEINSFIGPYMNLVESTLLQFIEGRDIFLIFNFSMKV